MDTLLLMLNFFVFVLSNFVLARFTAIAPDQPVVAVLGANAILPCHVSIPDKLTEVRYFKSVHKHLLNLYRDGKVQQECELKEYVGRTELIKDNIGHGSVALKILSVTVADEGVYYCYLQTRTFFDTAKFEIRVTALGSNPRIEIESFQKDRILAVCRSDGWYPKPTVLVKEDDGQTVALNDSEGTFQQQDNLFSLAYPRVITEASNRTFSCLLRTPYHPERMSTLYVADPVFRKKPSPRSCVVSISLFVSLPSLFLFAIIAVCCKRRQRKSTLEQIQETTNPNETIIQLRNEMKANAALAFKWQKELKEKDKAIEALKKELELLKMELRSGQLMSLSPPAMA